MAPPCDAPLGDITQEHCHASHPDPEYPQAAGRKPAPCFPRKQVRELTFGIVNPRTLANRDSEKTGPSGRFFVKREVWYQKAGFLEYVKAMLKDALMSDESGLYTWRQGTDRQHTPECAFQG